MLEPQRHPGASYRGHAFPPQCWGEPQAQGTDFLVEWDTAWTAVCFYRQRGPGRNWTSDLSVGCAGPEPPADESSLQGPADSRHSCPGTGVVQCEGQVSLGAAAPERLSVGGGPSGCEPARAVLVTGRAQWPASSRKLSTASARPCSVPPLQAAEGAAGVEGSAPP